MGISSYFPLNTFGRMHTTLPHSTATNTRNIDRKHRLTMNSINIDGRFEYLYIFAYADQRIPLKDKTWHSENF